jgi:hypothetical protein
VRRLRARQARSSPPGRVFCFCCRRLSGVRLSAGLSFRVRCGGYGGGAVLWAVDVAWVPACVWSRDRGASWELALRIDPGITPASPPAPETRDNRALTSGARSHQARRVRLALPGVEAPPVVGPHDEPGVDFRSPSRSRCRRGFPRDRGSSLLAACPQGGAAPPCFRRWR